MDIVYEDKRIVVAVKPAGVVSVDQPGGMPELLRQTLHTACIRTVHRLDAPVAGLMVFARSAYAAGELSRQIREGEFEKTYLAVVRGAPETDEGELTDLLGRDKTRRMTYVAEGPGKDVREARLRYRVLDRRAGCALIRVRLLTGRTHQIRVQFASRGMPLVGDRRYGDAAEADTPIALWSAGVAFRHPETGKAMAFELAVYGAAAGALYRALPRKTVSVYLSLIIAMIAGRLVWGVMRYLLAGLAHSTFTPALFLAGAVTTAIPGIILHIILIPALVIAMDKARLIPD